MDNKTNKVWVTNMKDPKKKDTYEQCEWWHIFGDWFVENNYEFGPPKATEKYSSEELVRFGKIGIYKKEEK